MSEAMVEVLECGWRLKIFKNELGSYTCIARKDGEELVVDGFGWWDLLLAMVEKIGEQK